MALPEVPSMSRLTAMSTLILVAVTTAAIGQVPDRTGSILRLLTAREVSIGLSASRTDIQRDAFWETVKGKEVRWLIEVSDVTTGWFSGFKVRGMATPTLQVSCELEDTAALKATVAQINKGDRVVCAGNLGKTFVVLFGVATVLVDGIVQR